MQLALATALLWLGCTAALRVCLVVVACALRLRVRVLLFIAQLFDIECGMLQILLEPNNAVVVVVVVAVVVVVVVVVG